MTHICLKGKCEMLTQLNRSIIYGRIQNKYIFLLHVSWLNSQKETNSYTSLVILEYVCLYSNNRTSVEINDLLVTSPGVASLPYMMVPSWGLTSAGWLCSLTQCRPDSDLTPGQIIHSLSCHPCWNRISGVLNSRKCKVVKYRGYMFRHMSLVTSYDDIQTILCEHAKVSNKQYYILYLICTVI